jgi:alpha-amylase/alpha-mannosidase (GH57 family)
VKESKPALVIHGHFYQPPRENPWSGRIDRQPSAHPHHDWNEQILQQCYRPNAFARITDGSGRIERMVNTYAQISFNVGPTLMSWLAETHGDLLDRILDADRQSVRERGGHGNAIAQAYGHPILPLCNPRDLRTQVRWGVADFRHRFRREPEGLWLPEMACTPAALAALIEEGLRFTILSPYQAARVRPLGGAEWKPIPDGTIDPHVPYLFLHPDGSGRSIAVFFSDGPISHAIAFEGILSSSRELVDRCLRSNPGPEQLVTVATDGETYGHHFRFGERCLAHALAVEAVERGLRVTNYGEFLEHHPPAAEVEISPGPGGEGTSWSCAHGLGRWLRDCGCRSGGPPGWNQAWRAPLRRALDFLRDEAAKSFEAARGRLFEDPWKARDAYIELVLDRRRSRDEFLARQGGRGLQGAEREQALKHLELQRNALLMYTSCGWFFSDLSGLETQQILGYAARTLDLLAEVGADAAPVRGRFLELLAEARSNLPESGTGADVYRRAAESGRVTGERVAAHLSICSLTGEEGVPAECAGYRVQQQGFLRQQHGRLTVSTARLTLESVPTGEVLDYAVLAMHLGEMDFYAAVKPFPGNDLFSISVTRFWTHFYAASLPAILRIAQEEFGLREFGLEHVLSDARQTIVGTLFGALLRRLSEEYARLYEDNQRTIEMLRVNGFEVPGELRAAAQFSLGRQFEDEIRRQGGRPDPAAYHRAVAMAQESSRRGYTIDRAFSNRLFDDLIAGAVRAALDDPAPARLKSALDLLDLSRSLLLEPSLERAQEAVLSRAGLVPASLAELAVALGLSPAILAPPAARVDVPQAALSRSTAP